MVKNISLKLIDNTDKRLWIDDINVNEVLLKRFFCSLRAAKSLDEQLNIIDKIVAENGYNEAAVATYIYKHGNQKVSIMECNYDKTKNVFVKGKQIGMINV